MMVKLTPKQTNLTSRLTPSLLIGHMTRDGFPKRPLFMKGQRWKHIVVEVIREEEKRVWLFLRKWRLFIGEGGKKRDGNTRFLTLPPSKNVWKTFCLWCRPPAKSFWSNLENIIWITHRFQILYSGKIRSWREPKGNLGLCVWWGLVQILESGLLQH